MPKSCVSRSASATRKPTSSTPWRSGTDAPRPSAQLRSMPRDRPRRIRAGRRWRCSSSPPLERRGHAGAVQVDHEPGRLFESGWDMYEVAALQPAEVQPVRKVPAGNRRCLRTTEHEKAQQDGRQRRRTTMALKFSIPGRDMKSDRTDRRGGSSNQQNESARRNSQLGSAGRSFNRLRRARAGCCRGRGTPPSRRERHLPGPDTGMLDTEFVESRRPGLEDCA